MTGAAALSCNRAEVATNGTFMRGLDKVENISKSLEPGKLHELTLVLS